jgi:hypothetical protein
LAGTSGENSFINTGNVGIGTTSPTGKLHITSSGALSVANLYVNPTYTDITSAAVAVDYAPTFNPTANNANNFYGLQFNSYAAGTFNKTGYYRGIYANTRNTGSGSVNSMGGIETVLTNSGGGTVTAGYGLIINTPNNTSGTLANTYGLYIADQSSGTQTNTPFALYQAGAGNKNYFAGNIGINTTAPTALLDIAGDSSSSGVLSFRGTTDPKINILNGENFGIQTSVGGDAGLSEKLTVLNSGKVGIGVTAPVEALHVDGKIRLSGSSASQIILAGSGQYPGVSVTTSNLQLTFGGQLTTSTGYSGIFLYNNNVSISGTTGEQTFTNVSAAFAPTSGTAGFSLFKLSPTINQTGGANGITRGLYINPTLTAATDYRAIETTVGNVIFGSTSGNVGIGVSPTAKLDVNGDLNVSTYATVSASLALGTSSAAAGPGNLDMSGNLTIGGAIMPGGSAGTNGYVLTSTAGGVNAWVDANTLITSVSQYWQRALGSLAPTNITDAMNLGAIATSSAIVHMPGTTNNDAWFNLGTGNVGIGNGSPTPGYKLSVSGLMIASAYYDAESPGTYYLNPSGDSIFAGNLTLTSGDISAINATASGTLTVGDGTTNIIRSPFGALNIDYWNDSLTNYSHGITLTQDTGRVGIGTVNPDYALDVVGNIKLSSGLIAGTNGAGALNQVLTSSGGGVNTWEDISTLAPGSNIWQRTLGSLAPKNITDDLNLGAIATGSALVHLPGINNSDAWFNLGTGNVGIGTNSPTPGYKLDVNGYVRASALYDVEDVTKYINPAGDSVLGGSITMGGDITMLGTFPTISSNNAGTFSPIILKGSNDTTSVSVCIEGSTDGQGTPGVGTPGTCDGKLDAGTIDPPYTINGKKYATYLPSMTGVKEETTGNIALTTKSKTVNGYEYVIDFNNQPDGSDLWLFSKVTALNSRLSRMSVLLSPSENARTWYKIDEARHTLTLYASRPTTLSYRLTAPRFDDEKWKNVTPNGSKGFVINSPEVASLYDMQVDGNGNLAGQIVASSGSDGGYQVLDEMGVIAEETVLQAKTISAQVVAGLVNAQKIVSPLAEIDTLNVSKKFTSPIVETNEIKPTNNDLVVNLSHPERSEGSSGSANGGKLASLVITGLNNAPVATIDAAGNATLAGSLTAQLVESQKSKVESLEADNASVSGTLIAKNIQSETIDNLSSQIASSSSTLTTNYQLLSTNINAVQSELAAIKSQPLPNPAYYQNLDASYSNLTVNDTANIYKAHIADSLMVGTLFIQPSSILALSNDLYISSLDKIHLFDDAVVIAKNGNMAIKGELSTSSLAIKNTDGVTVASIDASGSAQFNEVIAKKFTLENIATQGAFIADSGIRSESNEIIPAIKTNTEVAGTGVVPADTKEIIIYNDNVTNDSLIYLTPTTQDIQGQLSVTKKISCTADKSTGLINQTPTCSPYFVVSSTNAVHSASAFNWLIIN